MYHTASQYWCKNHLNGKNNIKKRKIQKNGLVLDLTDTVGKFFFQWELLKRTVSNSNNMSSCLELTNQCGIINRSVNWKLGEIGIRRNRLKIYCVTINATRRNYEAQRHIQIIYLPQRLA